MTDKPMVHPRLAEFLEELQSMLSDDLHKRLIRAYQGDEPLNSMETELAQILMEVLQHES